MFPAALRLVPEDFARQNNLIPLDVVGDAVVVVMADPQDVRERVQRLEPLVGWEGDGKAAPKPAEGTESEGLRPNLATRARPGRFYGAVDYMIWWLKTAPLAGQSNINGKDPFFMDSQKRNFRLCRPAMAWAWPSRLWKTSSNSSHGRWLLA